LCTYGKRFRFQTHRDAFGLNTVSVFSHKPCLKLTSRYTIPDLKRYLFAMKFIFKHIFGHFLKMNERLKKHSRPQEKKTFLFCEKFKCSIFLYQQYYASSNVSTISHPQTQFVATSTTSSCQFLCLSP